MNLQYFSDFLAYFSLPYYINLIPQPFSVRTIYSLGPTRVDPEGIPLNLVVPTPRNQNRRQKIAKIERYKMFLNLSIFRPRRLKKFLLPKGSPGSTLDL